MIYIQRVIKNDQFIPHHFDAACAMYGAIDSGMEFEFVDYNYLIQGAYDNRLKSNLFIGSVEFMQEVFRRAGVDAYKFLNEQDSVRYIPMALKKARAFVKGGQPLFIKPTTQDMKKFSGMVFKDETDLSCIKDYADDLQVMTLEPYKNPILSEWRVYMMGGEIMGVKNYSGEHFHTPNEYIIRKYIPENPPASYCIDIAMLSIANGTDTMSKLVEYTDMWAVGNYGLENDVYLKMLKDRYFEIIKGKQ